MEELNKLLTDEKSPVDERWVRQMRERYPYFSLPMLLALKRGDVSNREDMLARLAIAWPDRKSLARQLGVGMDDFDRFYPAEPAPTTPDTDATIDRFLDNYGNTSPKEIEAIQAAIFNPMPDYADILAAQEREHGGTASVPAADDQQRLINEFIAHQQERERAVTDAPTQPHVEEQEKAEIAHVAIEQPVETDERMLSESLAKMYIRRHKYSQALEIIENISLKFPEKSIYFADQIRFLRKLVLIEEKKQQNNN